MGDETAKVANISEWTTWANLKIRFIDLVVNEAMWLNFIFIISKVLFILIAGRIIIKVANKAITHAIKERDPSVLKLQRRRMTTIGKLVNNVIKYTVNFITILLILSQMNFQLGPLLAGAGVIGLAIGFGAQSLVKDVITGFFIIFEDQFAVGDVVQIGAHKGTVEEIGLRITKLRSWTGETYIIPNGTVAQVINYSLQNSVGYIDIPLSYDSDVDQTIIALKEMVQRTFEESDEIVKEPEVLGVETLAAGNMILRVAFECKPNTQPTITRKMNEEIKKLFETKQIVR